MAQVTPRVREQGSPPLARGTVAIVISCIALYRITPACAGNSATVAVARAMHGDHPRLRGEQIPGYPFLHAATGSPPLARGTGEIKAAMLTLTGITPACAGNRPVPGRPRENGRDHPRLRGEQKTDLQQSQTMPGSPPLARGTERSYGDTGNDLRITPACAGNSRWRLGRGVADWDHPRLRGEQQSPARYHIAAPGSPPLARGTVY